ncbi:autotransporter [Paraburkholderia tropica]|uniref:autotransporter n=1 Tax=Paraburkholderia tropica TaxID=92647 RepID=UPI003D2E9AEC
MSDLHALPPPQTNATHEAAGHETAALTEAQRQAQRQAQQQAQAEPQAQPQALTEDSTLGRFAHALSRTGQRLRAAKFDISTAAWQRSSHGKPFAPTDFKAEGQRLPEGPVTASTVAATPLENGAKTGRAALAKTAASSAQASAQTAHPVAATAADQGAGHALADAMDGGHALLSYVAQRLPGPRDDAQASARLSQRLHTLGAPADAPAATRGALLAQALHGAHVGDAGQANDVLDALGGLDFTRMQSSAPVTPAQNRAWHVATLLSRSDAGFEALEHLRAQAGAAAPDASQEAAQPPTQTASQRLAQRMMLQTADTLEHAMNAATHDVSPAAVAARHAPAPGASLKDTPLAWRAYNAASTFSRYGRQALTDDQKGAFFAWRQNFREDGPGTELSRARERLNKFSGKTIDRAGDSRWKSFLPRLFGKQRSPLSALRYGTQGVPRKTVADERKALKEAMQDALPPLVERPEMRPAAALAHARPERSIAELAALHVWLESGGFANGRPNAEQLSAIAQRAETMATELTPRDVPSPATLARVRDVAHRWAAATPHELARSAPFKSIARGPFDLERLASWGKVAQVPADSQFWAQLDDLKQKATPDVSTATPADPRSADDLRQSLKNVANGLQSSSRLRLTDGARLGVSTRGLSANIGKVLHAGAVPVAPRVDLRASKSREAVVELSRGTQGVEMFLGTTKTSVRHAGAGVLVGYDFDVGLTQMRAGLTTQAVLHSRELSEPSGVSLRVARRVKDDGTGYDDNAMREKLSGIIDHVFDETTHAHAPDSGGSQGTWNRLAQRYFDDPDVSVSWTDTVARTVKRGASADVGVSVKLPGPASFARVGATAGVGYERTAKQTLDSKETSGRMQIEQHRVGAGSRLLGRFGASVSATENVGKVGVGFASLDAPSGTLTFADDSHLAKIQLVREDGKLMHRACLFDTEYSSAHTYTQTIDASREQWIDLFAEQIADEQHTRRQADPDVQLRPPRELAAERLDQHLGDVKANRRPNQTYFHRYRLRRDAASRLDTVAAVKMQLPADAHAEHAQLDAKSARILQDPASWMPAELKVKERTTVTRSPGLNFMVQMNTQTSATGDRELFAQTVPFGLLERVDQRARPDPNAPANQTGNG